MAGRGPTGRQRVRVLEIGYDIDLLPKPNEVRLVQDEALPPADLITSALA